MLREMLPRLALICCGRGAGFESIQFNSIQFAFLLRQQQPRTSTSTIMASYSSAASSGAPPTIDLTLEGVAEFLRSDACKSVVLLTGAGMSSGAGIPDFRSPGGMYDTLRPELITATEHQRNLMRMDPTYVVEKDMFMSNPFPYLEVRRPFIVGTLEEKWKATIAHRFVELLERHGKLKRLYTQNIDGLDFQCAGIPPEKIVAVHGSIGEVACESCGAPCDAASFVEKVRTQIKDIYDGQGPSGAPEESRPILCEKCGRPTVKPTTVLFGGQLPARFFSCMEADLRGSADSAEEGGGEDDDDDSGGGYEGGAAAARTSTTTGGPDLLIVAGTSLVVSPANFVAQDVPDRTVRLVVNREAVGQELGIRYGGDATRDVFAQGDCDDVFLKLIDLLGWRSDLLASQASLPEASKAKL